MPAENQKESISSKRIIVCEGSGDAALFKELIKVRALPHFDVFYPRMDVDPGGRQGFAARIASMLFADGIGDTKGIAIFTDSDNDPNSSFSETRRKILEVDGCRAPNAPGVFVPQPNGLPPLGVFMVPGPAATGSLEDLCLEAMESHWPGHWPCVDSLCECAHMADWNPGKITKAKLRVMLATICKKDPNTSLTWAWSEIAGH